MNPVISTDHLPAADQVEYVREVLSQIPMGALELESVTEEGCRFELRYVDLGATGVGLTSASPYRARRTPALIRRSAPDVLSVSLGLRGSGIVDQDGRQFRISAYDLCLWDTRRPYTVSLGTGTGSVEYLVMNFPRALFPLPEAQLDQLIGVPFPPGQGVGALTSRLLMELAAGMDHFSPAEGARLSTAALDVLATRLAHELDGDRWLPPETHKRALLVRIHAFIQERLSDSELCPGVVAAAHHITTRYLHMLFSEQGVTVGAWIRQRRLEGARRDLSDPAQVCCPVAAIAARWGFSSASQFSQVFKAAYGMPPQEYRQHTLTVHCRFLRQS